MGVKQTDTAFHLPNYFCFLLTSFFSRVVISSLFLRWGGGISSPVGKVLKRGGKKERKSGKGKNKRKERKKDKRDKNRGMEAKQIRNVKQKKMILL